MMRFVFPLLVISLFSYSQEKLSDAQLSQEASKLKSIASSQGKNSDSYFDQLFNYASQLQNADKNDEALGHFNDCLSIAEKKYGSSSTEVRNVLKQLATIHFNLKKYQECAKECQRTLTISTSFKDDQTFIIQWAETLAESLGIAKQQQLSIDIYRQAARWREQNHLTTTLSYYKNLKNTLDYCYTLNQHDSIPLYFKKISLNVPVNSNEAINNLKNWAGYTIGRKDYDRFQPIEEACEKFLKEKESRKENDWTNAEAWIVYGRLLSARGQVERALKSFTEAYTFYELTKEKDPVNFLRPVNFIVTLANQQQLYTNQTLPYLNILEQNLERINTTNNYVDYSLTVATYYMTKGDKIKTHEILLKALPKAEQMYGKDSKEIVSYNIFLKSFDPNYTGNDVSKEDEQKVIELMGLNTGLQEAEELGQFLQAGQFAKAITLFEKNSDMIGKYYLKQKQYDAYISMSCGIALCYRETGNFTKAQTLLQEAANTVATYIPNSTDMKVFVTTNEADFYKAVGQNTEAEKKYIMALKMLDEAQSKENKADNDEDYYSTLMRLAALYINMEFYDAANNYFLDVSRYNASHYGTESLAYGNSLISLAQVSLSMGELGRAERFMLKGLAIIKNKSGETSNQYIMATKQYASLLIQQGNYTEAEKYLAAITAETLQATGNKSSAYLNNISDLAHVYTYAGNLEEAQPLFRDLIQFHLYRVKNFFPTLSETEKAAFYKNVYGHINAYNWFARQNYDSYKEEAGTMYDIQLNTKGLLFKSTNRVKETILSSKDESIKKLYNQWLQEKDFLSRIYQLSPQQKNDAGVDEKVQEEKVNNLERQLTKQSELFANLLVTTPSWQAIQQKLLPGEAAVEMVKIIEPRRDYLFSYIGKGLTYDSSSVNGEYFVYNIFSDRTPSHRAGIRTGDLILEINGKSLKGKSNEEVGNLLAQDPAQIKLVSDITKKEYQVKIQSDSVFERILFRDIRYAALILTPEHSAGPELVLLENGDQLESRYSRFYQNAIKQKLEDPYSYQQFWAPIKAKLPNTKKVYFSPDGVYNFVNINTLLNPTTHQYVLDEMEVSIVNSTADLLLSKTNAKAKQATLIGFPDYNNKSKGGTVASSTLATDIDFRTISSDSSATRFMSSSGVNELPGTKTEVNTIEGILKTSQVGVSKLIEANASETKIKSLSNPDILHIATHGFFLDEASISGQNNERGMTGVSLQKLRENPLLRSGLLLAGAGNTILHGKDQSTVEDGILTAYEAMNLNLSGTSLVVLSACETGLGQLQSGEGVYGLNRAFRAAGARSVLMSLWKVDDEATQQLMTEFYNQWLKGKTKMTAFREAQLSLRQQFPHPYYWGAFLLVE